MQCSYFFFFFSSRRRHTRFDCDWSSDVCSSDLSMLKPHLRVRCPIPPPSVNPPTPVVEIIPLGVAMPNRSEEHTSELQSQSNLVCRLLLEKKKNQRK